MIVKYKEHSPRINSSLIASNATLIGEVSLQSGSSVWYNAVIRGDEAPIAIGENTNIQDNCTLHCSEGFPMTIGNGVTVGHNAILHGCTIGNNVLIGMGAIILNGATIGDDCIIGAGSLVTENKIIESGTISYGIPAKPMGRATDLDKDHNRHNALQYVEFAKEHFQSLKKPPVKKL